MLSLWGEETYIIFNESNESQEEAKLETIHLLTDHSNWIKKVVLSPDQTKLLSSSTDLDVKLWDLKTGELIDTYTAHEGSVDALAFSNDGVTFVSADARGNVIGWDIESTTPAWKIQAYDNEGINTMLITDSGQLILGGNGKIIQVRSMKTREIIHKLIGHTEPVEDLAMSPEGELLSVSGDATVKIWNIEVGAKIRDFQAHSNWIYSIDMSHNGKQFVTGGADSTIKVWDYKSLKPIYSSVAHRNFVFDAKFSYDDSKIISIGSDNNIKVWDSQAGCLLERNKAHFDWPKTLAVSRNDVVATGGYDKFVRVWQMPKSYGLDCVSVENIPEEFRFPIQKDVNLSTEIRTSAELAGITSSASIIILDGEYRQGEDDEWKTEGRVVNGKFEVRHTSADTYSTPMTSTVNVEGVKKSFISITFKNPEKPKNLIPDPFSFPLLPNVNLNTYVSASAEISGLDDNVSISVVDGEFRQFGEWQSSGDLHNGLLEVRHLSAATYAGTVTSTVVVGNIRKEFTSITIGNGFKSDVNFFQLNSLQGHQDHIFATAITPDDKNIVSGSWDSTIKIWDLKTGTLENTLEVSEVISAIEISHDGQSIISGGSSYKVRVWDFETGVLLNSLEGHTDQVHSIAINPADTILVSGGNDQKIIVWDLRTGKILHEIEDGQAFHSITVTKDGKYIVAGGREHQIKIWNLITGSLIRNIETNASIYAIDVSPDGERIISGGLSRKVNVWNFHTGENVFSLFGHTSIIREIAVSPHGRLIFSSGIDGKLNIWDLNSGDLLKSIDNNMPIFALDVSDNGRNIALGGGDKSVRLLQIVREGNLTEEITQEMLDDLSIKTKTNVDLFSHIYEDVELYDIDGNISIDIKNGEFRQDDATWASKGQVHNGILHLRHLSASDFNEKRESRIIFNNAVNKKFTSVTYANSSKPLQRYVLEDILTVQEENIDALLLTEDERYVVFVTNKRWINVLDIEKRSVIRTVKVDADINSIDIDKNGSRAVIGDDLEASVWNLTTGEKMLSLLDLYNELLYVKVSPDDATVATSAKDKTVKIWDLHTGTLLYILEHEEDIFSIDFSNNNEKLATASKDGTIHLWNVHTRTLLVTLYQENAIKDVAFTPDDKRVVTGGWDKTVRVWDIETEQPVHTFIGHSRLINAVQVSFDGKKAISGGWDKVVKVWDIDSGKIIDTIIDLEVIYALSFNKAGDKIFTASGKKINLWKENNIEFAGQ